MDYFLHIESATDVCSVAISKGSSLIELNEESNSLKHSEIITLQIKDVLDKANIQIKDLAAVSLSEGPGSYTSLRVGMSAAKAVCYGNDIPLISINTLQSLAHVSNPKRGSKYLLCSMIDARRMEVYSSLFHPTMEPIFENKPVILDENTFSEYFEKGYTIIFSGNGAEKTKELFQHRKCEYSNLLCSAENLISIAKNKFENNLFEDIAYFSPNYVKPPNITKPKPKKL